MRHPTQPGGGRLSCRRGGGGVGLEGSETGAGLARAVRGGVRRAGRRGGEQVCRGVADPGPGIPPAMRGRVFDRFFRLADANQPGSGLGLAIVRRVADAHGASVQLGEGLDGRGLGVRVLFPVSAAQ